MDFIEQLQSLATNTSKLCSVLQTEEATKNALIMPFINILRYDIFDPTEVIPEFIADVGIKKGEKVDYAIVKDGKIITLFECKRVFEKFLQKIFPAFKTSSSSSRKTHGLKLKRSTRKLRLKN